MSETMGELRYISAGRSHVGMVRKHNEDSVLARPEIGLWAVADGMGGHQRGDYASQRIVTSLNDVLPPVSGLSFLREVKTRLEGVNRDLRQAAAELGGDQTIGSTVVVLLTYDNSFCCLWAGDSRFYLMRDGMLHLVSHDHSYVQELVDQGSLTAEAASLHPMSNVITNAVGVSDELMLDQARDRLNPADTLLLCSDGLNRMATDPEIAEVLRRYDVAEAADQLIEMALARGARDNVSVVVIRCVPA